MKLTKANVKKFMSKEIRQESRIIATRQAENDTMSVSAHQCRRAALYHACSEITGTDCCDCTLNKNKKCPS